MATWAVTAENRKFLDHLKENKDITKNGKKALDDISTKEVLTYEDITNIKKELPANVPVCVFFSKLKLHHDDHTYKASEEFRKKTEKLAEIQKQNEYKRLVQTVDPLQKYGKTVHVEDFGKELKTVNRQVMSVINVLITVVGAFFFGFSGVTYAYPHLKLDLATRFIIGLVPATIVFFADIYFVIKNMDFEYQEEQNNAPRTIPFSFKDMNEKKND